MPPILSYKRLLRALYASLCDRCTMVVYPGVTGVPWWVYPGCGRCSMCTMVGIPRVAERHMCTMVGIPRVVERHNEAHSTPWVCREVYPTLVYALPPCLVGV